MGRSHIAVVVLVFLCSCVERLFVEGAPCPCPEGLTCCETLHACVADVGDCPVKYPSSTLEKCSLDEECENGELCLAWTTANGVVAGPRQCRKKCLRGFSCADDENCHVALHNSLPLDVLNLDSICLPREEGECKGVGCTGFAIEHVGRTYCDEPGVVGCFLSLDTRCGVSCEAATILECGEEMCVESKDGAECINASVDLCEGLTCSSCPGGLKPGETGCVGNDIVACARVAAGNLGRTCDALCRAVTLETCPSSCTEEGGAHCTD